MILLFSIKCGNHRNFVKKSQKLQDENIIDLSRFIYRVFNQMKVIDSNKDKDYDFIPSYLR